ncbi:hypothetical protein [Myroides phaeus]|uniref:hypothetical protein n=1 Tax=Myroides phaeus TaxID=702745 RepID=UPI0013036239|nr:hypothetical protein [Myroides phaeus]
MSRLVFSVILFACSIMGFGQQNKPKVEIIVLDSKVKDNSLVTVVLLNNTNDTYWFPWDTSDLAYSASIGSTYENMVFLLQQKVYNVVEKVDEPVLVSASFDSSSILAKWQEKVRNKTVSDYVIVKPKSHIQLRLPFKVVKELVPAWYAPQEKVVEGGFEYYVNYNLIPKNVEQLVGEKIFNQVSAKGYKLYTEPLKSNKVPIVK